MAKRQDLETIEKAFYALDRALESGRDFNTYYQQNLEEERGHRRFVGSPYGITAPQAARLFCVRQIASYLNRDKAPEIANIFSFRLSVYQAFALVETNRQKITEALKEFDLSELIALDYAELNKVAA